MLARCRASIKGDQAVDDGPRPGLLTCLSLFPESDQCRVCGLSLAEAVEEVKAG
jgi:hypothetical protein